MGRERRVGAIYPRDRQARYSWRFEQGDNMRTANKIVLFSGWLLWAAAAQAAPPAEAQPACAIPDNGAEIAKAFSSAKPASVKSAAAESNLPALVLGQAAELELLPQEKISLAAPPSKKPESAVSAGLFGFEVTAPGEYAVVAGVGVWLDVIKDKKSLTSTHHARFPDCSGVHKVVYFDLAPGKYVLQLDNSPAARVKVAIVKTK